MMRNWAAMGFIALYALCVLAPTAALAFNEVPCLTKQNLSPANSHADDATHEHDDQHNHAGPTDNHDDGSATSKCCGMVFCSALAPGLAVALALDLPSGPTGFAAKQDLTGLPPHKLVRPPRS